MLCAIEKLTFGGFHDTYLVHLKNKFSNKGKSEHKKNEIQARI